MEYRAVYSDITASDSVAKTTTANAYPATPQVTIQASGFSMITIGMDVATNGVTWKILGSIGSITGIEVMSEAAVAASASSIQTFYNSNFDTITVYAKSTVGGAHGDITFEYRLRKTGI